MINIDKSHFDFNEFSASSTES